MHCHIEEQLNAHGLRKTKDRHRLIELFEQARTWTAAQLHARLPKTDLSTIYRNLQHLSEKGLIHEVHTHDSEAHYEMRTANHHDHLICNNCDITECIPCPIKDQQTHNLEILDLCSSCK